MCPLNQTRSQEGKNTSLSCRFPMTSPQASSPILKYHLKPVATVKGVVCVFNFWEGSTKSQLWICCSCCCLISGGTLDHQVFKNSRMHTVSLCFNRIKGGLWKITFLQEGSHLLNDEFFHSSIYEPWNDGCSSKTRDFLSHQVGLQKHNFQNNIHCQKQPKTSVNQHLKRQGKVLLNNVWGIGIFP